MFDHINFCYQYTWLYMVVYKYKTGQCVTMQNGIGFFFGQKMVFLRNGCIAAFMQNINISYNNKVRRYNPNFTIFNNYMKTDRLLAFL